MRYHWMLCCWLTLGVGGAAATVSTKAAAADLSWSAQAKALSSDNIERDTESNELKGNLTAIVTTLDLKSEWGRHALGVDASGGTENREVEGESESEATYSIRGQLHIAWNATSYLEGTAGTGRSTGSPDPAQENQERLEVTTKELGLLAVSRPSPASEWQASVGETRTTDVTRDIYQLQSGLSRTVQFRRTANLTFRADGVSGRDDIAYTEWTRRSAEVTLSARPERQVQSGARLDWQDATVKDRVADDRSTADRYGVAGWRLFQLTPSWSFRGDVGFDGIRSSDILRTWEPKGNLEVRGALGPRVGLRLGAASVVQLPDPAAQGGFLARNWSSQAELTLEPTRWLTLTPRYRHLTVEYLQGEDVEDRRERSDISEIEAAWTPTRDWSVRVISLSEVRDSTEPDADIYENRFEIMVSGTFI